MPYVRYPSLAHAAIYTLNLIILRAHLSDTEYLLNENDLDSQEIGIRPWDRLVGLWRSWFAVESLAALASQLTTTRQETRIEIAVGPSPLAIGGRIPLTTAFDTSVALADNRALSPLTMGASFGVGQLLVAGILFFTAQEGSDES